MNRARLIAALTGILTALLLQAAVVAPVTTPWPVSLPAVLVAAVALVDGPAAGMSFGFAAGLLADLGSNHPAGVLALCWLGIGLFCGMVADRRSLRRDAVTAGLVCAVGTSLATIVLAVTRSGANASDAVLRFVPTAVGDALLAFVLLALVRRMLRTDSLRAPHPIHREVVVAAPRG